MGRSILAQAITRRRFLVGSAATVGAAAVTMGVQCDSSLIRRLQQARLAGAPHHMAWTWQFQNDGAPSQIAATLAPNQLAVAVKTHDGVDWMSTWDHSPFAITGTGQVGATAGDGTRDTMLYSDGVHPMPETGLATAIRHVPPI